MDKQKRIEEVGQYYVIRNKKTGFYFRGKGVNRWGKYFNQAAIYRIRGTAEASLRDISRRGEQAEIVPICITETHEGVVVLPKKMWVKLQDVLDGKCDICLEQTRKDTVKLCRKRIYGVVTKTLNEFFFRGENSKIKACEPIPTNDFVWFDGVMHERVNDCFDEIDKELTEERNGKKENSTN